MRPGLAKCESQLATSTEREQRKAGKHGAADELQRHRMIGCWSSSLIQWTCTYLLIPMQPLQTRRRRGPSRSSTMPLRLALMLSTVLQIKPTQGEVMASCFTGISPSSRKLCTGRTSRLRCDKRLGTWPGQITPTGRMPNLLLSCQSG